MTRSSRASTRTTAGRAASTLRITSPTRDRAEMGAEEEAEWIQAEEEEAAAVAHAREEEHQVDFPFYFRFQFDFYVYFV